ncbi:hypothetical protein CYMTET_56662 [Cymbomonas tetramitiformis]|uniref:Uncharacterized protein n=1 Tax=Cymbomonas tetramitiformis TaxID=36881 RepID=A0AAE0ELL6_9CHLO|nr:hypothetical protein CYMTET_56662 [Cymbomonas tetramitiformis]
MSDHFMVRHTRSRRYSGVPVPVDGLEEFEKESKPQFQPEPPVLDNQDLSTLLLQQMKLVEDLTRKLMFTEQQTNQCSITITNAPKVVQSVLKSLGSDTKYSGSERNSYESWTRFSTQLQLAVSFYPELVELVSEDSIRDIANLKDVQGCPVPGEDPAPDLNVGAVTKPESVVTVEGAATLPSAVLSVILVQKNANDAKKLVCAVCSGSHPSESCWIMRPDLTEEYIKEHPDREKSTRRLHASKKKRLAREKSEETETCAAAISVPSSEMTTDEIWEAEQRSSLCVSCRAALC